MSTLLVRRFGAFVLDALAILALVLFFFIAVTILWDFSNPGTFESYRAQIAAWQGHDLLIWVVLIVVFGLRDFMSDRRVPTALRLFGLRVFFPFARPSVRLFASIVRAGVFLAAPWFIAQSGFGEFLSEDWNIRASLTIFLFVVLVLPISVAVPSGGRWGLHDLIVGSRVYLLKETPAASEGLPWRGAIGSILLTVALAGIVSVCIEMGSVRAQLLAKDFVKTFVHRAKAIPGITPDEQPQKVVDFRKTGLLVMIGSGTNQILDKDVPAKLYEELTRGLFEWLLAEKTTTEAIQLRDGPDVPVGFPYLHLRTWSSKTIYEDYMLAPLAARELGRSLLTANQEFALVLVSLERISRIGPVFVVHYGDLWVVKDSNTESFHVFLPLKRSHGGWINLRFVMGRGTAIPYVWQ